LIGSGCGFLAAGVDPAAVGLVWFVRSFVSLSRFERGKCHKQEKKGSEGFEGNPVSDYIGQLEQQVKDPGERRWPVNLVIAETFKGSFVGERVRGRAGEREFKSYSLSLTGFFFRNVLLEQNVSIFMCQSFGNILLVDVREYYDYDRTENTKRREPIY
jgi:hypothetical protein